MVINKSKKAQTLLFVFLLAILIIIVVLGFYYFVFTGKVIQQTNPLNETINSTTNQIQYATCPNTPTKTYVKSDPNCIINFLCIQGTQAFKDSCGCGCEQINLTQNQTSPRVYNIIIQNFTFNPQSLTINAGDSVVWKNLDYAYHTVTSDSGSELNSNAMDTLGTYSHTFLTPGTYDYHCNIYTYMSGTVIVQ